ncbi:hypothetical protein NDU88_001931 [Pleurodeles waltl]|uniref:Uncharacterized protein n=1 Tax=Pleurodeles waltl TaxID=8319 RepID=A0AAV7KQQ3_PLEWA|nr:hypothetical protein NDU88_001931 [Pleurodeles waltl]
MVLTTLATRWARALHTPIRQRVTVPHQPVRHQWKSCTTCPTGPCSTCPSDTGLIRRQVNHGAETPYCSEGEELWLARQYNPRLVALKTYPSIVCLAN